MVVFWGPWLLFGYRSELSLATASDCLQLHDSSMRARSESMVSLRRRPGSAFRRRE